jgi:LmbE family N-acetylglucosaminyl deacetylase
MRELAPLLGTTLILVAHPDDEVIGFGALMQRMRRAIVVFATDGAPRDEYFWKHHGSREAYAEVRRQEAREALGIVGAEPVFLADQVHGGIADQELFRRLPEAVLAVEAAIAQHRPDAVLTLSYEGGHPDHDSACFIASIVGRREHTPVWEAPLYHRNPDGSGAVQEFTEPTGNEIKVRVEGEELRKKVEMFHSYKSQKLVLDGFRPQIEQFRPVRAYDFTRPPLPWKLNYEHWQWHMTGEQVAREFSSFLNQHSPIAPLAQSPNHSITKSEK